MTLIFSESTEGMQSALNIFQSYCDKWKLTVKVNKTRVLVFSKKKCQQNFDFTLNGGKTGCNRFFHISWYYLQIQWFICGCQKETCRASSKVTFYHLQKNQKPKYTNRFATEIV